MFSDIRHEYNRYLGILYQYRQIDLPYSLLNNEHRISYEGHAEVSGTRAYVFGLSSEEGTDMKITWMRRVFSSSRYRGCFPWAPAK
jgi:hypothetical protein